MGTARPAAHYLCAMTRLITVTRPPKTYTRPDHTYAYRRWRAKPLTPDQAAIISALERHRHTATTSRVLIDTANLPPTLNLTPLLFSYLQFLTTAILPGSRTLIATDNYRAAHALARTLPHSIGVTGNSPHGARGHSAQHILALNAHAYGTPRKPRLANLVRSALCIADSPGNTIIILGDNTAAQGRTQFTLLYSTLPWLTLAFDPKTGALTETTISRAPAAPQVILITPPPLTLIASTAPGDDTTPGSTSTSSPPSPPLKTLT